MSGDQHGCEWVFLLVPAYLGSTRPTAVKQLYVCMIAASILECIFVTVVLRRNSKETVQTLFWMYYVE